MDAPVKAYAMGLTAGLNRENCRYKIIASDRKTLDIWVDTRCRQQPLEFKIVNPFWFTFNQECSNAIAESENFPSEGKGRIMIQRLPDMARSVVHPPGSQEYSFTRLDGTKVYEGGRNDGVKVPRDGRNRS